MTIDARQLRRTHALPLLVALLIHAALGVAFSRLRRISAVEVRVQPASAPVEFAIEFTPEPPPAPSPDVQDMPAELGPPTPTPPTRTRPPRMTNLPKLAPLSLPVEPRADLPSDRPSPNQQAPAKSSKDAIPIFGVTMNSVVGDRATPSDDVPVGNTTMARPQTGAATAGSAGSPGSPGSYSASDPSTNVAFTPDVFIATRARVLREVNSGEYYPRSARALGIEGTVRLLVGIGETGKVVSVKVIKRAGNGFDEQAVAALKQFLFSPGKTSAGRPVASQVEYDFVFRIED